MLANVDEVLGVGGSLRKSHVCMKTVDFGDLAHLQCQGRVLWEGSTCCSWGSLAAWYRRCTPLSRSPGCGASTFCTCSAG